MYCIYNTITLYYSEQCRLVLEKQRKAFPFLSFFVRGVEGSGDFRSEVQNWTGEAPHFEDSNSITPNRALVPFCLTRDD